jgi:hypothetical protein
LRAAAKQVRHRLPGSNYDCAVGAVAELVGEGLDAVAAPREQGQPVAAGGERAGGGLPDP